MLALRLTALLLALLGLMPMANFVTTGNGLPWWSLAMREWALWGGVVVALSLATGALAPAQVERAFERMTRVLLAPSSRVFALVMGALTTALSLYFGWKLFGRQPVAGDEFAQRFQSLLLVHGRLSIPTALPSEFFNTAETLNVSGRWFSQFPMGGPAILAFGVHAGVPWLVNPLLAAVSVAAIYDFARSTTDEVTARVTALLAALCPTLFFMAGTQMNHTATLALLWIALAALARWHRCLTPVSDTGVRHRALSVIIGACVGTAATIRPFDAFVVAFLIGAFQLATARKHAWLTRSLVIECAAGLIPVILLLLANTFTTGSPFAFAYDVLNGPEHRPGFHLTPLGFDHTPRRGLYMASAYLMKLDIALFSWPLPAMLLVVVALLAMKRASAWDKLCMALVVAFIAGYAAYWAESYFLGPRFLFVLAPVFVLYTAAMPAALRERLGAPRLRAAALLVVPLLLIASWIIPGGGTLQFGVRQLASLYRMRSGASAVAAEVELQHLDHALVLLDEPWRERLIARLRAVGVRPLLAEQLVVQADACTLQRALDAVDGNPQSPASAQSVFDLIRTDAAMSPQPAMPTIARVSLVPGRPLAPECANELSRNPEFSVSVAEMLPYAELERSGALGGRVVYARDLGLRNERLRAGYGDRSWYIARSSFVNGEPRVTLELLRKP